MKYLFIMLMAISPMPAHASLSDVCKRFWVANDPFIFHDPQTFRLVEMYTKLAREAELKCKPDVLLHLIGWRLRYTHSHERPLDQATLLLLKRYEAYEEAPR